MLYTFKLYIIKLINNTGKLNTNFFMYLFMNVLLKARLCIKEILIF